MDGTPRFDAIVEASTAAPRETTMNTNGFGKSARGTRRRFGWDRCGGTSFELFERLLADCFRNEAVHLGTPSPTPATPVGGDSAGTYLWTRRRQRSSRGQARRTSDVRSQSQQWCPPV